MTPGQKVLIVDDERPILLTLSALLQRRGFEALTASSAAAARQAVGQSKPGLVLLDLGLPDADGLELLREWRGKESFPVIVLSAQDTLSNAIESIKLGAFHFISKPYAAEELMSLVQRALEHSNLERETVDLRQETQRLAEQLRTVEKQRLPLFKSRKMMDIETFVDQIAPSDANVLITGESGTGKEVLANLVHSRSRRAAKPIVKLNCAAFPAQMIEGELFGYVKGAFTGAVNDFPGMIEAAGGGTLFLDEIGEMPAELQTRFLRVLQEREYRNLGSTKVKKADFRLVAATNRDVRNAVAEGKLRQDLYYRINTFQIELPPLRERRDEIPALAHHFTKKFAARMDRKEPEITAEAMRLLVDARWTGNVRELENAMEYAVVLSGKGKIEAGNLPREVLNPSSGFVEEKDDVGLLKRISLCLEDLEREAILEAMRRCRGNKSEAAELLGIHRPTLYGKMRRLGIRAESVEK